MTILEQVLQKLGIDKSNLLVKLVDSGWKDLVPYRLQKGLEEIKPDRIYLQNEKPLILFFEFDKKDEKKEKEISKKIWNLGGTPIIFFIKNDTVSIYNGFLFDNEKSIFQKLKIENKNIELKDLSFWDITSGKLWHKLSKIKESSKVDEKLLENIQSAQEVLVSKDLNAKIANNLIGRLLFSRYLLDRGVKVNNRFFKDKISFLALIKDKTNLYKFFAYIKENFNGDLFPLEEKESTFITNDHLDVLHSLFAGTEIATKQISLFEHYDFNIIPVELISEVYERFMGEENQRKEGAYYTPAFLVDYILQKTVREKLKSSNSCKVFDPSCGSGIFLVETLRCIIEKKGDKKISNNDLKKIIEDNIFGVDKDENAVNLTIFSLYLTLLDYQDPKDISAFKFPNIKNKNIFHSDFFDLENGFNNALKKVKLDFVLGNPPWNSDKEKNSFHEKYINYLKENNDLKKNDILVSDKQFAQTFVLRAKDFSSKETSCSLVLTSKILYNHKAVNFRAYLLKNFFINRVLELSPVRDQLFKGAKNPSVIIFYKYAHGKETKKNIIKHTSIKPNIFLKYLGVITIEKNNKKEIQQEYFQIYDWLWKIMLYGNVFDFYLIKRLKEKFDSLNSIIEKNNLTCGQGFIKGSDSANKYKAPFLLKKLYIDTNKKELKKFFIHDSNLKQWEIENIHRPRNENLFRAPYVLLKRGFNKKDFSFISVYSEKNYVFTNSITAIKGEDKTLLKNITGILNSKLYSYFLLLQDSSAGVEREESKDESRFQFPVVIDERIPEIVEEIQELNEQLYESFPYNSELENQINVLEQELNSVILKSFRFSQAEQRLLDYALKISIPVFNKEHAPHERCTEVQLKQYSQIFKDHFGKKWNGRDGKYFEIDVYKNDFIVGMNFKVINKKGTKVLNFKKDSDSMNSLSQALNTGLEKITNDFSMQRDIRGFQKNSFYIIKPNEYKNWHPAVAQIDFHEFLQDMLEVESKDNRK